MMPRIWRSAVVALVLAATRQATAQQPVDLETRLAQRLDPETHASVMRVVQNAKDQQLPVEPIMSKALLGAAFKQPASVITQSANVELERLVASREALAPKPTSNDIKAGAEAIALGVPSETIRDLRSKFPDRSMVVALAVLGELVANKVPLPRAAAMVKELMRRGASEGQLVAFSEKVRDDIVRGIAPNEALAARTEGLIARLPTAPVAGAAGDAATGAFQSAGTPKKKP
jgi:hypothetical protein